MSSFSKLIQERCIADVVRRGQRFDYDIHGRQGSKQLGAYDVTKLPFQSIPLDRGVGVFRNNDPYPHMTQRGSRDSELETFRPNTLPLFSNLPKLRSPRDSVRPREFEPITRRRTWMGV